MQKCRWEKIAQMGLKQKCVKKAVHLWRIRAGTLATVTSEIIYRPSGQGHAVEDSGLKITQKGLKRKCVKNQGEANQELHTWA